MNVTVFKNALREIKISLGRYISIFLIAALGVGFFAGITAAPDDMRLSADRYFDGLGLADFRLVSTFGFDQNDIDALYTLPFAKKVYTSYFSDLFLQHGDAEYVSRVMVLSDQVNVPLLTDGRLPEKSGECIIDTKWGTSIELGSRISFRSGEKDGDLSKVLYNTEYTVVGFCHSPMYPADDSRGITTVGNGIIQCAVFIPETNFAYEYYTEVYINADELFGKNCYSAEYKNLSAELKQIITSAGEKRELGRYNEIVSEAEQEIDNAEAEYLEKKRETETELADAKQELDDARQKLDDAKQAIIDGEADLASGLAELNNGQKKLDQGFADYEQGAADFNEQMTAAETALEEQREVLNRQYDELEKAYENYDYLPEEQQAALDEATRTINVGFAALDEAEKELSRNKSLGKSKLDDALNELAKAENELIKGRAGYEQGRADLDDGIAEYEQGEADYEQGLAEYGEGVKEANQKFAEAEQKIADAKRDLADLSEPVWYVYDRGGFPNYTEYGSNADRINNIAKVFPAFFLLVAALVCSTTVTRMVEENRVQVGLFKALGYGGGTIVFKYLLYAVSAAVLGCALGLLGGMKLFPYAIIKAYQMMYNIEDVAIPYNLPLSLISLAASVVTVSGVVLLSIRSELSEQPAALMRPKAPKKGKRVFLERIGFIWSRIGFSGKVSLRNIFRYKRRMLMTIVGIAGCTALLLTGLALKDSIGDIIHLQFGVINKFSGYSYIDENMNASGAEKILADHNAEIMYACEKSLICEYGGKNTEVIVSVIKDSDKFGGFITAKNRVTREEYALSEEGVLLTEKVSNLLGVKKGDNITIKSDTLKRQVKIGGIIEYYAGRALYMTEDVYAGLFGERPDYGIIYFIAPDGTPENLKTALSEDEAVLHTVLINEVSDEFSDIMKALDSVIGIIIISAGILAFVVLYNLTNININERVREIATLKVLGFYDLEVDMYIFRENLMLTLMGCALGLIGGVYLSMFVITTAEVDDVMFGRTIHVPSFIIAALITLAFSSVVSWFMHYYLKKINMAESLKSVD